MKSKKVFSDEELREKLSKEQYRIMRERGTEAPFTGKLLHNMEKGVYTCAVCGNKLFLSDSKFDSGTGWPSFDAPISKDSVKTKGDLSNLMIRTEVICTKCGSHLGHVFSDGPTKTMKRFCINSCALGFKKSK